MAFGSLLIFATVIYAIIYFFDLIFKTCSHYPYLAFLQWAGLQVGFFRVTWSTAWFNRRLQRWGGARLPKLWFSAGVGVTLCLLPLALYLLLHSAAAAAFAGEGQRADGQILLVPMVPGVNLPLSDFGFLLTTLLIASVLHELGHVAAARAEGVGVAAVGVALVFLLPAAFTRLHAAQLAALPARRQLRVLCAGVWHNVVLAAAAYVVLLALPLLAQPLYATGSGVSVTHVIQNSPLSGATGVLPGDTLTAVNDCEVADAAGWRRCLRLAARLPPLGFCVDEDLVHQLDESVPVRHAAGATVECCAAAADQNLCFEALWDDAPLHILQHSCLPGRTVIGGAQFSCRRPRDCPSGLHCVRPVLPNDTSLLRVQRARGPVVIFLGRLRDASAALAVSSFVPRTEALGAGLVDGLEKLCRYLIVFSSGFAVVNAVPCFFSDGSGIVQALLRALGLRIPRSADVALNAFGLLSIAANFAITLWQSSDLRLALRQEGT